MRLKRSDFTSTQKVTNGRWRSTFIVVVGLFCLAHLASYFPDYLAIVVEEKYVSRELHDLLANDWIITFYDISSGLKVPASFSVYACVSVYVFSLVLMVTTRWKLVGSVIALISHVTIIYSVNMFAYGVDFFTSIALFYSVLAAVNPSQLKWLIITMQAHMMYLYFISGFSKAMGFPWRDGESIYRALTLHNSLGLIKVEDLHLISSLFPAIGWMVVLIELLFPLGVAFNRIRPYWIGLTIAMHTGIALGLGLVFFSTVMIILNLFAFIFPYLPSTSHARFTFSRPT